MGMDREDILSHEDALLKVHSTVFQAELDKNRREARKLAMKEGISGEREREGTLQIMELVLLPQLPLVRYWTM